MRDRMYGLSALLLFLMSGAAIAQTTGTVNPRPALAEPSMKEEDPPPGGCMPIGLTVSGQMVFPIQCKEFIERHRGKAVEQKPAAVEAKPASKQSESVAPENSKPLIKRVETVPLPKRVEDASRERARSPDDRYCSEHYRSYDPASRTYMGYDGQRRSCR
jgi:hypothetical protein